jgi:hypothetical protein
LLQWSSFSRQLNLYGWLRVTSGPDYGTHPFDRSALLLVKVHYSRPHLFRFLAGAYYHELFIRPRPDLHSFMRRVGKPHLMDRRKHKLAEGDDPNFYGMSRVPEAPPPPPTESIVTTTTTTTTTTAAAAATASTSSRQGSAPPLRSAPASSSESESGKAAAFGNKKEQEEEDHTERRS